MVDRDRPGPGRGPRRGERWASTPTSPSRSSPPSWSPSWVGWRYRVEAVAGPPIPLTGDSRTAVGRDRPRPERPRRGRLPEPARRGARHGGRRAPAQQGARRLRDQRRAAARQEGRRPAPRPRDLLAGEAGRGRGRRRASRSPGPGFLNIRVEAGAQGAVAAQVVAAGASYGASDLFAGEKVNLEFVSANPTGPIHLGGTRWAAVGDALGRIFTLCGRRRHAGVLLQRPRRADRPVRALAARQRARAARRPRTATAAQYIVDIAQRSSPQQPDVLDLPGRRGPGGLPASRRRADVRRDQGRPCTTSGSTSTSTSTRTTCTSPAPSSARSSG